MNKTTLVIVAGVLVLTGLAGFMALRTDSNADAEKMSLKGGDSVATIYKSPTCGCCGAFVSYMKKEGYDVRVEQIQDMRAIKQKLGVPYELESCHTMEIGGYIVEGHIPEEAVQKLLTEKPDIKGIGMAGMPSGSPGMPGSKVGDFIVYEITHTGDQGGVFMTI